MFWDKRLSANGQVACASCHSADTWEADSERYSQDAKGNLTKRNSQTVFNSMLQPHLRWTGHRKSGAHQAEKSLTGSMGLANPADILALFKQHGYETKFKAAFPANEDSMSPANYSQAIEAYESTLRTPAPFDRYLNGQTDALNDEQKVGPYFHDGSVATLSETVRVMEKVQLDQELDATQIKSIVAFLGSLTGEVPANYYNPH